MRKFMPPELKSKDGYTVQDIIVLNFLRDFPTQVKNPMRKITGGSHEYEISVNFISYEEVLSKLLAKDLIRVSNPDEMMEHLTNTELREVLKKLSQKSSGAKSALIERIKNVSYDKEILKFDNKKFFVVTEKGMDILKKYRNVVWIHKHKKYIFVLLIDFESSPHLKFDEYYFMNHLNENPSKTIIDYYESRDSGIVARTYMVNNDSKNAFYYGLRELGNNFDEYINSFKTSYSYNFQNFLNHLTIYDECLINLCRSLNLQKDNLEKIIDYIYEFSIKNKSLVSKNDFRRIIILFFEDKKNNYETLKEVYDTVFEKIRINFPQPKDSEIMNIVPTITDSEKEKEVEIESCVEFFNFYLESYDYDFFTQVVDRLSEDSIEMLEEIFNQHISNL
ncbi:hypothetical protein LPAF129_06880 [Ligilactobacillus pabuli]|uniref:SAP domain-containing protein n=2 Tax=Ligilactobacillus pabuli TaxID=2886039 RepID=A0ABQ5JH30_9LACO|nr:hypothetical protein LPAF129_06880 [Ligilactobacillus pabuli]